MDHTVGEAAGFWVSHAQRHVKCAADFLIKQGIFSKPVNLKISSDGKFTDITCPGIRIQLPPSPCPPVEYSWNNRPGWKPVY
jgi:hypothetical protein